MLLDTNLTPFEYDNMTATTDCHLVCAEKSFFYKTKKFKFYDITKKDGKIDPKLKPAKVTGYGNDVVYIGVNRYTKGGAADTL